jgi:hypothetical protein
MKEDESKLYGLIMLEGQLRLEVANNILKIRDLETKVLELEERLKEKEEAVIEEPSVSERAEAQFMAEWAQHKLKVWELERRIEEFTRKEVAQN